MKYKWETLPKPLNCFTVRSAVLRNMDDGKIVQNYPANTKIQVVQKCVTPARTYYRTAHAVDNRLNWAFEASAFGLPNEAAPLVHNSSNSTLHEATRNVSSPQKQTPEQKTVPAENGAASRHEKLRKKLLDFFRKK